MSNVTLSINDELLKSSRAYAKKNQKSLNQLIRELLRDTVENSSINWLEECFRMMDSSGADSKGKKWRRKDLYDV